MTSRGLCTAERLFELEGVGPVLGLDTGGSIAALALIEDGRVLAERSHATSSHGAGLPAAVDDLMREAGSGLSSLKAVAVGIGPGSFTGLRVGLSYAKGLVMALGCALVGVPTFDAIALAALDAREALPPGSLLCPVMDARKGEVYTAIYEVTEDAPKKHSDALVLDLDDLLRKVSGAAVTFVGDGKAHEALALASQRGFQSAVLSDTELQTRGRCVAAIGAQRFRLGEKDSPARLEPLYVRASDVIFKPRQDVRLPLRREHKWSRETKNSSDSI